MSESSGSRVATAVLSNLSSSDGSAVYSFGDTVLQCSVFGPTEVAINKEQFDCATVEVVFRKRVRPLNRENAEIKLLEQFLRRNCEAIMHTRLHPRTLMTIIVHELQSDGSLLASCVNAICCALLDHGFELKYMLAATSAVIDKHGLIVVNASNEEADEAIASFTIVFDSVEFRVVSLLSEGNFTFSQFQQCVKQCRESAHQVLKFYRNTIQNRFNK